MIRTRFSPSPTGLLHLGNARAALFSALYATHAHGVFLLRIEDTDAARSDEKFTEVLLNDLHWLGLEWQEGAGVGGPHGPYWQSQRREIYNRYYQKLEDEKRAYPCFCTDQELALNRKIQLSRGQAPRYPGTCRKLSAEDVQKRITVGDLPALRFRVPENAVIEFIDTVKGPQKFNSDDIGDFIIRRADGSSSFMFCNAIDDSLMEITHVIRGEDHLTNTPRQLMLLQALNMRTASYGHLSLILGDDGTPLSKRHGSSSLHDFYEKGFLQQAVLNYLARLSHTYEENKLLSFAELAQQFKLEKLSKASARFDINQLLHWQKESVLAMDHPAMWKWLGDDLKNKVPEEMREPFIEMMRQNILSPSEAASWIEILFGDALSFSDEQLSVISEAGEPFFVAAQNAVKQFDSDLKSILDDLKTTLGVSGKKLFMPVRVALTGEQHGPELPQIALLLGPEKMQQRFSQALSKVRK